MAFQDQGSTDPQHQADPGGPDELHGRSVPGPGAHDDERAFAQVVGPVGKPRVLVGLAAEGLDLADALEVIHQQRVHGARCLALSAVTPMRRGGVPERARHQERHRGQGDQHEGRIVARHEHQSAGDAQESDRPLFGAVDEQALDIVDVLDHARHEVARGPLVEPVHGQALQPRVDRAAHVVDHVLFKPVVDSDAKAIESLAQEERPQKTDGRRSQGLDAPLRDDLVDQVARQLGIEQPETERDDRASDRRHHQPPIRAQVNSHPANDFPRRPGLRLETGIRVGAPTVLPHAIARCMVRF